MIRKDKIIFLIYLPWILSWVLQLDSHISFVVAWLGSFFIFYVTIFSPLSPLRRSDSKTILVMKPLVIIQLVFAGFMCCTSIFYFIDKYEEDANVISQCQRLSLLAHASLVSGLILLTKPPCLKQKKSEELLNFNVILGMCLLSYFFAKSLNYLPPLIQFKYPLQVLSINTATYLLVKKLSMVSVLHKIVGLSIFSLQFIESTLTGFKEGIIIQILTLAFLSFHFYPRVVLIALLPCMATALYILPTYTIVIRAEAWANGKTAPVARDEAYQTFFNEGTDQLIMGNNWTFLTNRFSEMGMFEKYVKHTPDYQDFSGTEILKNTLISLIPRVFWDQKPITEVIAMQRVYDAGVANPSSNVSAKTRPVVDGYLMWGAPGVFLLMLAYGLVTQKISNIAETMFKGYELGCIIIFNSLFQQLWRGNTLEFLMNNILYGLVLMLIIYALLRAGNFLKTTGKI